MVEPFPLSSGLYLGENGEMSCLSLAQLTEGGGTPWTSHGNTASAPSITDIGAGSVEPLTPDLGRTGRAQKQRPGRRVDFRRFIKYEDTNGVNERTLFILQKRF